MKYQLCALFTEDGADVVGASRLVVSQKIRGRLVIKSCRITKDELDDRTVVALKLRELRYSLRQTNASVLTN